MFFDTLFRDSMNLLRRITLTAAVLLAAGCGDLALLEPSAQRMPTELEIVADQVLLTVGEAAVLKVVLRDQHGRPFEHLPPWAQPVWQTTNAGVLRLGGSSVEATSPGEADVRVQVADRTASLRLRVNPVAVRLGMHAYVTQSVQNWDGTLPLVAGRDAVLRVFLSADQVNFFAPVIRARFFRGGAEVASIVSEPRDGVPVQVSEGVLASSYNVVVPGTVLRPGTSYAVEALTDGVVPVLGGSVQRFPAAGGLAPLDVMEVPTFRIRFVPVVQPGAAMGNVTASNVGQFMAATATVYPLGQVEVDVRQPYTSTATTSTESGWSQLLNEVRVLRLLDGETRYYHGIVRRLAHWAGLGYIGHPVALSYDPLPAANWTVAHELGHNWGRYHAPCGNPSGIDASFPHAGGTIGVHGLEFSRQQVHGPGTPDLMGYCSPRWVSDYTYRAVAAFRAREAGTAQAGHGPGLVIWGRITADGRVIIEPPIPVARTVEPPRPGPYRMEGMDAAGAVVLAADFAADAVSEGADGERHFAFTVPMDDAGARRLASLRLRGGGVRGDLAPSAATAAGVQAGQAAASPPAQQVRARAAAGRRVELRWDAAQHPLVVVRDGRTGQVLSLARGGRVDVVSDATELDLDVSDGVRSTRRRVTVER
jgi:hypothetical protein